jgi:hypothetical protein
MMDGEYHADFTVLFLICHQSRLEIQPTPIVDNKSSNKKAAKPAKAKKSASKVAEKLGKYELDLDDDSGDESELDVDEEALEIEEPTRLGPENCWLEAWTKLAGEQGTRAKERLRDGVQLAIQTFGAGFYTCSSNSVLHERLRSGELSTQNYYRQLLRLVYRLLMLMVAEDKRTESGLNLLHPIDTPAHIRDRYNQFYSVGRIRKLANDRRGTPHRDLYESLKTTFLKLRDGYPPLGIPGIGSFLFSDTATPDLDSAQITNEALLDAFRNLCFTEDSTSRGGSVRRAVDFGNLGSEELGSIYESLLELHPEIDSQDGPFVLRTAAGNERKTSGSYYTPTSLINCLLDSALDPVVNQAIDVPDREEAKRRLLDLKVCDPACGSGHFLIAAANRMALHLARLETQDTEPTTLQIQHAKRQIIGRCIYGVDINEMAVELCKVSLWMEALEPGKPFSFLENHIKCGNSLLGATPRLLNEGIPDDAFNPIEGDSKDVSLQLTKQNKRERIDRKSGQRSLFPQLYKLGNIADRFSMLTSSDDETLESIALKQKEYEDLVKGSSYLYARFWADTWCAAFVWNKEDTDLGRICPTERKFREIEDSPHAATAFLRDEVQRLANQYQFFHWHLAFPDVFRLSNDNTAENSQTGWSRGFDVVLGNPPWEKINFRKEEFFAELNPEIASASNKSTRAGLIAQLKSEDLETYRRYDSGRQMQDRISSFLRLTGLYPLTGLSRINLYSIFAELSTKIVAGNGCSGMVLASGIATDKNNKDLFKMLVKSGRLRCVFDFENRKKLFPDVDSRYKFCLMVANGSGGKPVAPDFAFFVQDVTQLSEPSRHFTLDVEDLEKMNPTTGTCPVFRNAGDANLTRLAYSVGESWESINVTTEWPGIPRTPFNMANDSKHFVGFTESISNQSLSLYPLYEAKLVHQFNHRFATFMNIEQCKSGHPIVSDDLRLQSPEYVLTTRYSLKEQVFRDRFKGNWFFVYREVSNATNERTVISTIVPGYPCGHSLVVVEQLSARNALLLSANQNAFAFDFVARQKVPGVHLNLWIWKQLPIVKLQCYSQVFAGISLSSLIANRALDLTYTAWDLAEFALDCEYDGPPFRWDSVRRFRIRCELDAAYFHLYLGSKSEWGTAKGKDYRDSVNETLLEMFPTPRDAVSYIMDTFPIVRRKDEAKYGEYRTKRVILEIYDQMTEIIEANEAIRAANPGKSEEELRPLLRSYKSPLNPPPGPPTDANGDFIPYVDWTQEIHRQYSGVIHPQRDADQVSTILKNSTHREGDNG